jgi:hypothetical protein
MNCGCTTYLCPLLSHLGLWQDKAGRQAGRQAESLIKLGFGFKHLGSDVFNLWD